MNYGANKGPDGDHCLDCRKKSSALSEEQVAKAVSAGHSAGGTKGHIVGSLAAAG